MLLRAPRVFGSVVRLPLARATVPSLVRYNATTTTGTSTIVEAQEVNEAPASVFSRVPRPEFAQAMTTLKFATPQEVAAQNSDEKNTIDPRDEDFLRSYNESIYTAKYETLPEDIRNKIEYDQDRIVAEEAEADAIGDKVAVMHRRARNRLRQAHLWDGHNSHVELGRRTRSSGIYRNPATLADRLPRAPMPTDLGTMISPTVGLLHAYRLHHARMFLHKEKEMKVVKYLTDYKSIDEVDLTVEDIPGVDMKEVEKLMATMRDAFKSVRGMGPQEKIACLETLKKVLPKVANTTVVEQAKTRRRRK